MIKNAKLIENFEREFQKSEKVDYKKNFYILEEMFKEAVALKVFPLKNPTEGLEIDIKIAKVVNSVSKTP